MISPEMLRAFPFFAGLTHAQIVKLSDVAAVLNVDSDYYFFKEGEIIKRFYFILEGSVSINIAIPDPNVEQPFSRQITRELYTQDVRMSTLGRGEVFGWSAIIPPHESTASVRAITPARVIEFDFEALRPNIENDCWFAYLLTQKAAQIIRERMRAIRIELLAVNAEIF